MEMVVAATDRPAIHSNTGDGRV